jgi:pyrroline-5-carboxylate reductase
MSVSTGVALESTRTTIGPHVSIARAMPNTAVARGLLSALGLTLLIDEEMMMPATALCA